MRSTIISVVVMAASLVGSMVPAGDIRTVDGKVYANARIIQKQNYQIFKIVSEEGEKLVTLGSLDKMNIDMKNGSIVTVDVFVGITPDSVDVMCAGKPRRLKYSDMSPEYARMFPSDAMAAERKPSPKAADDDDAAVKKKPMTDKDLAESSAREMEKVNANLAEQREKARKEKIQAEIDNLRNVVIPRLNQEIILMNSKLKAASKSGKSTVDENRCRKVIYEDEKVKIPKANADISRLEEELKSGGKK